MCPAFLADGYVFPLVAGPNPTVDIVLLALSGHCERNALGDQASDIIQHAMQLSSSERSAVVASNDNGVFHDLFRSLVLFGKRSRGFVEVATVLIAVDQVRSHHSSNGHLRAIHARNKSLTNLNTCKLFDHFLCSVALLYVAIIQSRGSVVNRFLKISGWVVLSF